VTQAPTSNTPYSQEASREEKAAILREADRAINTRVAYGKVIDPEAGGRFAKEAKADFTVGRDEVVSYPRLPAGGPWGGGPQVPEEPPFSVDISYVEPCGEPFEAERAAAILEASAEHSAATVSPPVRQSDEAGFSHLFPPAMADLASPLLGSANSAPLTSSVASVAVGCEVGGADPSSSLGSGPRASSEGQQLAAPSVDAAVASVAADANRAEHVRGGAALSSRGSMTRRFG
jgi:hypothetical protein